MTVTIKEVITPKDLKNFIRFQMKLYKGNPSYVPPLMGFELSTLDPKKNPAFEHSKAKYWLAYKNGEIVGRVAGIILDAEIEKEKKARFGWIDFIDDLEVSEILLSTVSEWAKTNHASFLHGPMGFTDIDFEGSMISGFEHLATQATIYNFPYYQSHFENFGFEKAVDWLEGRGTVPDEDSKRLARIAGLCTSKFGIRSLKFKKNSDIKPYAPAVFKLLNKSYSHLYGYYPLTPKQIDYYIKQYFEFIDKDFVSILVNKDEELIGMAITMPSISRALQKAKGSLFPFGFIHLLKELYFGRELDLFLIGVDPEYQKLGAHAIIFNDLMQSFKKRKIKTIATGPMLEENAGVQNLWDEFKSQKTGEVRRRCYIKTLTA